MELPRSAWAAGALPSAVALAASFAVLLLVTWLVPDRRRRGPDPDVRAALGG